MLLRRKSAAPFCARCVLLCLTLCLSVRGLKAAEAPRAPGVSDSSSEGGIDPIDVQVVDEGSSSWRQRRAAVKELPLQNLSHVNRNVVDGVLDDLSLYRRLPVVRCETDPDVIRLFTRHPDAAVSIWRAMGISDMQLQRVKSGQFKSDSGDGTAGVITLIHDAGDQKLIVCDGLFKGPMLSKPIKARALMHLRTSYSRRSRARRARRSPSGR